MLTKAGGDERMEGKGMMNREREGQESYDYMSECLDKLDSMIENPKLATAEGLMEIRDKLANEGEIESETEPKEEESDDGKHPLVIAIKKGMKLLVMGVFIAIGYASFCMAENLNRDDWENTKFDLYRSSVIGVVGSFAISTYPVVIGSIDVSTATTSSCLTVYDSTATNIVSSRRKTAVVGGSTQVSYQQSLQHKRGLSVVITAPAATYTIKYREK